MRRVARFLSTWAFACVFLCLFAVSSGAASSQAAPTPISVLKVEGAIDRALISHLNDRLASAEQEGAIVVLELNTSGTLNEDGVALAERVASLKVPVIAWVGPAPARASGAGLLLMYASSLAAVSPGSQTGPLDPIDLAHPEAPHPGLQETIQGWLDERGKTTKLERLDEPLTAQEAIDLAIATVHASSVPELLGTVDGLSVSTPGGPVTLQTRIATDQQQADQRTVSIAFDNLGPVKRLFHAVSSPSMVFFLLVIGLACVAFEITQPGFGFAGFAGVGMLALAAYGLWVVPPAWPWLAVMIGGIGLMTLDVRLRKLGPLTAAGLVAFGLGSYLSWHSMAPAMWISPWLVGGAVVASALYYGFALTVAIQSRDRIVNTQRGLIGLIGEARGRLAPEGPVYVKGAMWRGRAAGDPIASGTPVRVRGVDGMVLKVEAEPPPPSGPGELEPSSM